MDENGLRQSNVISYLSSKETYIALAFAALMLIIDSTNPKNDTLKISLSFFNQYIPVIILFILTKLGNSKRTNKNVTPVVVISTSVLFGLYIVFYLYENMIFGIVLALFSVFFHIFILPPWLNIWPKYGKNIVSGNRVGTRISG